MKLFVTIHEIMVFSYLAHRQEKTCLFLHKVSKRAENKQKKVMSALIAAVKNNNGVNCLESEVKKTSVGQGETQITCKLFVMNDGSQI